jgi:hypothetical protein
VPEDTTPAGSGYDQLPGAVGIRSCRPRRCGTGWATPPPAGSGGYAGRRARPSSRWPPCRPRGQGPLTAIAAERTLCHLDGWPASLIDQDGTSVLLDWSFTGDGAVSEDAANLIIDSCADGLMDMVLLPETADSATDGCLRGLRDGGWTGSADTVRTPSPPAAPPSTAGSRPRSPAARRATTSASRPTARTARPPRRPTG